ncbi:MAG: class IV adenylate cyclase, partial [Candidatus Altiarchaeales archaeon]|nr:class IV adenylate cyclase [Candidatus Altiarchaeales archaeon]
MLEIEIKAPCGDIKEKLKDIGAVFIKKERQEDTYYNAPHKDFRETDEVLRVRRVGSSYLLTYKGSR